MNVKNFYKAVLANKKAFKVEKEEKVRYVFASSTEQCQAKFGGWNVKSISLLRLFYNYFIK